MKRPATNILLMGMCIVAAVLLIGSGLNREATGSGCDQGVELQLLTDKNLYSPGASMRVRLLVINTGQTSIYLFRDIGQCSSQYGWLSVSLHDEQNREVESWGCSDDDPLIGTRDFVGILTNPKSGVFLRHGEIYGREEDYDLPKKKGVYRLQAELAPAGFSNEQNEALSQHQMRVLRSTCLAPTVTLTVK
jgi:hypothetical protein